jgi:hypothetical protein
MNSPKVFINFSKKVMFPPPFRLWPQGAHHSTH